MSRLSLYFLIIIFSFSLFLIVDAYRNVSASYEGISAQVKTQHFKRTALTKMYNAARERSLLLLLMLTEDDAFKVDELARQMSSQAITFIQSRNQLMQLELSETEKELLKQQNILTTGSSQIQDKVVQLIVSGDREKAGKSLYKQVIPSQNEVLEHISAVIYLGAEADTSIVDSAQSDLEEAKIQFALILLGTVLSVFAILFFSYRASKTQQELLLTRIAMKDQESERLNYANDQLGMFTDALSTLTFLLTPEGRIKLVNQSAFKGGDGCMDEFVGRAIYDSFWFNYDLMLIRTLKRELALCASGKPSEKELLMQLSDDSFIDVHFILTPIFDDDGKVVSIVAEAQDITDQKKIERKISFQASHDSLTGLINRYEFERRLSQLIDKAEVPDKHFVLYMDLDQFKIVNDTCGHTAGDELLRQLPALIKPLIRQHDTLARLGGDEFGLLLEYGTIEHTKRLACHIIEAVKDYQFFWQGQGFRIGVSIGVVEINNSLVQPSEVLKWTDSACYAAKDKGRNTYHFYTSDDQTLLLREQEMTWIARVHQAIEEDRMEIYAQTIEEVKGNRKSCEFLVRLNSLNDGIIPPGAFLPAVERYGKAMELDKAVFSKAFALMKSRKDIVCQLEYCSMNISAQSIIDPAFLVFSERLFSSDRELAKKVCIEITETSMIGNMSHAIKFIEHLKKLGVRFALDDFGSGLSSFGYLKKLPVDYLKIDGMFVKDIHDDPIDYSMVKSIHEVASVIGIQTIAEFVEDKHILNDLKHIGVNYAQGYHLSKPVPFKELGVPLKIAG